MDIKKAIYLSKNLNKKNKSLYFSKAARTVTRSFKPLLFRIFKKKFELGNAFVVFSEARGGSTWIMEVLQESLNGITLFEPLNGKNKKVMKLSKKISFASPFHFSGQRSQEIIENYLTDVLAGKVSEKRILQFNTLRDVYSGENLIVKFVNVNLIAPWFANKFDLRYKPIYVLRHPLAILASREKYSLYGEDPNGNMQVGAYNRNRLKSESHPYLAYLDELDRADNRYCRYIAEWCIRNKAFLKGTYNDDFHLIFYEDMVLRPEQVLDYLATEWNINFKDISTRSESGTTDVGGRVYEGQKQLSKWCQFFSEEEKKMMQLVLDRFDVKLYSAFSPNIIKNGANSVCNTQPDRNIS